VGSGWKVRATLKLAPAAEASYEGGTRRAWFGGLGFELFHHLDGLCGS